MKSTKSNSRVPAPAKSTKRAPRRRRLSILRNDPWLEPYADAINGRHEDVIRKEKELTANGGSIADFANAHKFYGLHRTRKGWVLREWAPNATEIYVVGNFNDWKETESFRRAYGRRGERSR